MPPDLALWLTLISSNYPYLEHIFMVPKVFKPLKFYCILTISNISSKVTEPIVTKSHRVSGAEGKRSCSNCPGQTQSPWPNIVKPFKTLFKNQMTDGLET